MGDHEETSAHDEEAPAEAGLQHVHDRIDMLSNAVQNMAEQMAKMSEAVTNVDMVDLESEEMIQPSLFDPTESLVGGGKSVEEGELPYEDLFKDTEDCGAKVSEGIAKRVNNACTKKPAKEQFSKIQKKYVRPENCEYLKSPRVNPELWDDLQDKTKSREGSFQGFQKNLIKGVIPVIMLADKVVEAKKRKEDSIKISEVYDLVVDAMTLLGNSVYDFSMKRRELLKSEVAPAYKSLCHESQPITTMLFGDELPQSIRNISQVKRMAARSVTNKRKRDQQSSKSYNEKKSRYSGYNASLNYRREYAKTRYKKPEGVHTSHSKSSTTTSKQQ